MSKLVDSLTSRTAKLCTIIGCPLLVVIALTLTGVAAVTDRMWVFMAGVFCGLLSIAIWIATGVADMRKDGDL